MGMIRLGKIRLGKIRLGDVRYNAQMGTFEARVDIERDGTTYRYPCQVPGPLDMDAGWVSQNLTKHALRQSDSGQFEFRQSVMPNPICQ